MERIPLAPPPAIARPFPIDFALPSITSIRAEKRRRLGERLKANLGEFVKAAWPIIEPATPLIWNWHLDTVCEHVQALVQGKLGKKNLIINVPPGSMKSIAVSVCTPAWIWTWNAAYRGAFASGNPRVSSRDSVRCRMLLESSWYKETFAPTWCFKHDQNQKLSYGNTATGERLATSVNAKVTGERYHGLWVDDALDANEQFSQVEVDGVNNWWDQAFWNRIADFKSSTRCIIGQRLREDDLPGHVMERDGMAFWELLKIPQVWEEDDENERTITSLGWTDPRRYVKPPSLPPAEAPPVETALMFSARFPADFVVHEKVVLGTSGFEGQHQQRPSMLKGEIFARGHAQFIQRAAIPPASIIQKLCSLDPANKEKEENDYSVLMSAVQFDRGVFIDLVQRDKYRYTALKEVVRLEGERFKPHAMIIEDKQSGQQLIQEYEETTPFSIVRMMPIVDKVSRARPLTPFWESNRIFFPCDERGEPEPWVGIFLKELYAFPKVKHDDQVDAFTQLIQYLFLAQGGRGLMEFYAKAITTDKAVAAAVAKEEAKHHPVDFVRLNGAR